jgi:hypothetical protein
MRGLGLFFPGISAKRNDPIKLVDPNPIPDYGTHDLDSGDAGKDGYTVLSRAQPNAQGVAPPVPGVVGPTYMGPAADWEQ